MNDRERLIELIAKAEENQLDHCYRNVCHKCFVDKESEEKNVSCAKILFADYLIANGVTIQKYGRWIIRGGKRYCSECGKKACVTRDSEDFWYTVGTDYCPNCGAKMEKEAV